MSDAPGLRRALGIWGATSIVVGTIIGSGIFLVPSTMIQRVGDTEIVFLVWIAAGLLSLAGALSYAELAAALPEAGGEYVYLREAYGPFWGFLYSWTMTWVGKAGGIATIATGFVLYLANFLPILDGVVYTIPLPIGQGGGPLPITYGQVFAAAMIGLLALINYFGVRIGGGVQVVFTVAKVILIGGIVVVGLTYRGGSLEHLTSGIPLAEADAGLLTGFFAALVAALWALDGWNNVGMVASEVNNPRRNLPRAFILGTVLVLVVHLLTHVAYFYVLTPAEVAGTSRVAATAMARVLGSFGADAVSIVAMVSMFGALNGSLLVGARIPYAAARDGLFFASLGHVHPGHRTPSIALLVIGGWASLLVFSGRYEQLFTCVIFAELMLYGMATAAVLVLRRKRPEMARPYRTWGYPWVPVLFVLAASVVLLNTLVTSPRESIIGLGLIFLGLPFY
ncbi:MAG: amino acid permease, partial [bacterium]|nr:amino acid permease [bacterium]